MPKQEEDYISSETGENRAIFIQGTYQTINMDIQRKKIAHILEGPKGMLK